MADGSSAKALGLGLLLAALGVGFYLWQATLWMAAADKVTQELRPLGGQPADQTGPLFLEPDSYYWMLYARRIAEGEGPVIRYSTADNAPKGREVHWSQSVSWSLVGLGWVRSWFHPEEGPVRSMERASVWLNPCLFVLFAWVVFLSAGPQLGWITGGFMVVTVASLGDVLWAFQPLRPDHQSFHLLFGLGTILTALASGLDTASSKTAIRWMVLSGIFAGCGLWVSATVQTFFNFFLASAATSWMLARPSGSPKETRPGPGAWIWVLWGGTAASVSFIFYLIEYAPHFPWQRLEVNHPLYGLGVLGTGFGLAAAYRLVEQRGSLRCWGSWAAALLGAFLTVLPIAILLRGPAEWHTMRHVEMLRFHNFIKEFYTYSNFLKDGALVHFIRSYGLFALAPLVAPWLAWRHRSDQVTIAWIWFWFILTLGFLALGLFQIRWLAAYACSTAILTVVLVGVAFFRTGTWRNHVRTAGVVLLLLALQIGWLMTAQTREVQQMLKNRTIINELLTAGFHRQLALTLARLEHKPSVLLADPNYAPVIAYYASIPTIVSFYWENLEGLRASIDFWADESPDGGTARAVAQERGITHVLIEPSDYLSNYYYFMRHGFYDLEASKQNIAGRILYEKGPPWIRSDTKLTYRLHGRYRYLTESLEHPVLIFRIED